jgi:hypothetical protein
MPIGAAADAAPSGKTTYVLLLALDDVILSEVVRAAVALALPSPGLSGMGIALVTSSATYCPRTARSFVVVPLLMAFR